MYTLDRINEVASQLQRHADECLAEIEAQAAEGDPWAIEVVAEWVRLGDPSDEG